MAADWREAFIHIFMMVKLQDFLLRVADASFLSVSSGSEVELRRFVSHLLVSLVF